MTTKPLSPAQKAVLLALLERSQRASHFDAKTVASLMRRGLVEKSYQLHPEYYLDMSGWYVLSLTPKGRKVAKVQP
jgi:hypothetical protein